MTALRKVKKKHTFTLDPDPNDGDSLTLDVKLVHSLSHPRGTLLSECIVLPPRDGAAVRLSVTLDADGESLEHEELLRTPAVELIQTTLRKYMGGLGLYAVENSVEHDLEESEVVCTPGVVFLMLTEVLIYSLPVDLCPLPYVQFASPTFAFKPHASFDALALSFSFSLVPDSRRSLSDSVRSEPMLDKETARATIRQMLVTLPLALAVRIAIEKGTERIIHTQLAKRWPWVFNAKFREDFARDLACYNSISSSIVSILNGIEHDQLRLLRRRDRAEVLLNRNAASALQQDDDSTMAEAGSSFQRVLLQTFCRLHADLSKPTKLSLGSQATPREADDSDLELEVDLAGKGTLRGNPAKGVADVSDFEDLFALDDGHDKVEDVQAKESMNDIIFDEAWPKSDDHEILDIDSNSDEDGASQREKGHAFLSRAGLAM